MKKDKGSTESPAPSEKTTKTVTTAEAAAADRAAQLTADGVVQSTVSRLFAAANTAAAPDPEEPKGEDTTEPDPIPEAPETEETTAEGQDSTDETTEDQAESPDDESEQTAEGDKDKDTEDKGDGLPPAVKALISELREDRRNLKEEVAQLRAEVQRKAQGDKPGKNATVEDRVASLETHEAVQSEIRDARQHLRWVDQTLRVIQRDPEKGAKLMSEQGLKVPEGAEPEQLENILYRLQSNLEDAVNESLPKRAQFIADRAKNHETALAEYPWLQKGDSREFALAQKLYDEGRRFLDQLPNRTEILGIMVDGLLAREARAAAKKAAAEKPKAAPKPPTSQVPTKTPMPSRTATKSRESIEKELLRKHDVAAFLTGRLG